LMARTIGTLMVIIGFFIYIYAANVYVAQTYFNRGRSAGTAVPIQETIKNVTQTITQYIQVATVIVIAAIAVNIAIKSRRILGIIPFKDVQRHLLLLGPTGSGKTTIAKKVIDMAVRRGIKVTILDWKAGLIRCRPNQHIHG
jgi:polynucleotide 5'-kinase involved in rRNA processing